MIFGKKYAAARTVVPLVIAAAIVPFGAADVADRQDISVIGPYDEDNSQQTASVSSNGFIKFDLNDQYSDSTANVEILEKDPNAASYTNLYDYQFLDEYFDTTDYYLGREPSNVDSRNNDSFTVTEENGNNKTNVRVGGEELTIEVDSVGADSDRNACDFFINGNSELLGEGESFEYSGHRVVFQEGEVYDSIDNIDQCRFVAVAPLDFNTNQKYYRIKSDSSDGTFTNEPGVITTSTAVSPVVYSHFTGSELDGEFEAFLKQNQEGNFNLSLIDASNSNIVAEVRSDADSGVLEFINNNLPFVQFFDDTTNSLSESFYFPTTGSSFWGSGGTTYEYYWKVEETTDGITTRSKTFSATSPGSSTNDPPVIDNITALVGSQRKNLTEVSNFDADIKEIRVCASDPDNKFLFANASLTALEDSKTRYKRAAYSEANYESGCFDWNDSAAVVPEVYNNVNESGSWKFSVNVSDNTNRVSDYSEFSIEWGTVSVESFSVCGEQGPISLVMERFSTCSVDLSVTCSGGECKIRNWLDPIITGS